MLLEEMVMNVSKLKQCITIDNGANIKAEKLEEMFFSRKE
jgi:hypothetical protein